MPLGDDLTPLHYAVLAKSLYIVKILVEQYAELNAMDKDGRTALHIACETGIWELVEYLTEC